MGLQHILSAINPYKTLFINTLHYQISAFDGSLRPSFDKLIITSFQHICMCLVCVLRPQTEFCLKYGDYSSIAAWATSITL